PIADSSVSSRLLHDKPSLTIHALVKQTHLRGRALERLVAGPKRNMRQVCGGQQLDVVPCQSLSEKPMRFEIGKTLVVRPLLYTRKRMKRGERSLAVTKISGGEFPDNNDVNHDVTQVQSARKCR